MKVLLVGAGGVGGAIASIAAAQPKSQEWLEKMIVADYNLARAQEVCSELKDTRFVPSQVNASDSAAMTSLARKHDADFMMNACDPRFNMMIFQAAFDADCIYMDMAMSLSSRHPESPFEKPFIKLGDHQFAAHENWEKSGKLAIVGSGVEPGMVNVFARHAEDELFDEIHELNVRDADNLTVEGMEIAFGFSIWTTIEECLNPPVVWESDTKWYCTEAFSQAETFPFPEPVGPVEVVNVEHEEVLMLPRRYASKGLRKCTFKYGLDADFRAMLKTLEALNLDKTKKVKVGGCEVSPRDVVAACQPDPAKIGPKMQGAVCAGLWVKGLKNGKEKSVYLHQIADNQQCMDQYGSQAVVAQTAFNPVIMMELLARGIWKGKGVLGPENFPAGPFMDKMESYGFPWAICDIG